MGYACPVCDEPQQDAEHLANHLAFQAMTHGDTHESWLDEHAPDWSTGGPADLAPRVAELAPEAEYEVVFEDTTEDGRRDDEVYDPDLQGERPAHGHGQSHDRSHGHGQVDHGFEADATDLDPETRTIVENAQELTREMLAENDGDGDRTGAATADEKRD